MKQKRCGTYSVLLSFLMLILTSCGMSEEVPKSLVTAYEASESVLEDESAREQDEDVGIFGEGLSGEEVILADIPAFSGEPYVVVNENIPDFQVTEYTTDSFESYSELDSLGRCGVAYANIGTELMPTEDRENIGQIKPTGWQIAKYDVVEGRYLYNRCHLIGFQLTGENANERNLITGTRYMNVSGMLPFENMVAEYVRETDYHVLYRVTPIYESNNLVASGVQMEAWSVEDEGEGICFNVYVYNHQPGIHINYATGESRLAEDTYSSDAEKGDLDQSNTEQVYVLNTNTMKMHLPSCSSVQDMKPQNREETTLSREELVERGYQACKLCNP